MLNAPTPVHAARRRAAILALVISAILLAALPACQNRGASGFQDVFHLDDVDLSDADKEYLVEAAYRILEGNQPPDPSGHDVVTDKETRGVFVSHGVHGGRALVTFSMGNTMLAALKTAAGSLRDRVGEEMSWRQGVLKIDVIDGTGKEREIRLYEKVRFDRTRHGMIFAFGPPIALLPEELVGWNIVAENRKLQNNNTRKYLKFQRRGRVLSDALRNKVPGDGGEEYAEVSFARFATESFGVMDGERVDFFRGKRVRTEYPKELFFESAKMAGDQLRRFLGPEGKFLYSYRPELDRARTSYNELRHCGTVYSMLEVYEMTGDERLLTGAQRAIEYIFRQLKGPKEEDAAKGVDWLAIKGSKRHKGRRIPEAKLGGAGLCLLMLTKYEQVSGDTQYRDEMAGLARFIEFMQKDSGEFHSKYYYQPSDENFQSLYYPGEAMLGLMRLYQLTGERHWVDVAVKGMDYIALVRDIDETPRTVEHDHWVMYALNELYRAEPKEHYLMHLKKIARGIQLKQHGEDAQYPDYVGGFYSSVRSTPAATRNEGMIAGYKLLKHLDDPDAKWFRAVIDKTARFQLWHQFTDENAMYLRNPAKAYGGIKEGLRAMEMRIDYSQHHISAMLGYYRILKDEEGSTDG